MYKSGIVIEKVRGFSSSTEEFTVPPLLRFSLQSLPGKHTCTKLSLFTIFILFFLSWCCTLHWLSAESGCEKADFLVKSTQMNVNDIDLNPCRMARPPSSSPPVPLPLHLFCVPMLSSSLLLLAETSWTVT